MDRRRLRSNTSVFALVAISSIGVSFSLFVPPKPSKAPSGDGLGIIVGSLHTLQSAGSGFGRPPDLITTSRALFLAQLYGRLDNLHRKSVEEFVKSAAGWETEEGDATGDSDSVGNIKDVETLHAAILCYQSLGMQLPKLRKVRHFLLECWNEQAGLFGRQKGAPPHIRASAHAMAVAEQLGKVHKLDAQTARMRQVLGDFLAPAAASVNGTSVNQTTPRAMFQVPKNLSEGLAPVSANYFAVLLAGLTEFKEINATAMAEHLEALQVTDKSSKTYGGVHGDDARTTISLDTTAHAVITLQELTIQSRSEVSLSLHLDEHALLSFLARAPSDLKSAYLAHFALASTPLLAKYFRSSLAYDVASDVPPMPSGPSAAEGGESMALTVAEPPAATAPDPQLEDSRQNQIVQGTKLQPLFSVTTFNGLPHAGLTVHLRVCPVATGCEAAPSDDANAALLKWHEERQAYFGEETISTDGVLGELLVEVRTRVLVAGLGEVAFDARDVIHVGYGIKVSSVAMHQNESIPVGGKVSLGTDFRFQILLFTASQGNIVSGDFAVKFHALDSSLLPVGSKVLYGENRTDGLSFGYELPAGAVLPSGRMHFVFQVAESGSSVSHSHTTKWFDLPLQMAACNVSIDKPRASLGDSVHVTMTPGVLTNGTFRPYCHTLAQHRRFVMDLVSSSATKSLLGTVPGLAPTAVDESDPTAPVSYLFEWKVGYNLRSIGQNMVSFRFLPAQNAGVPVPLSNIAFDLTDEVSTPRVRDDVFFTVAAELRVKLKDPPSAQLSFGSNLTFSFTIHDEVTQTVVDITGADAAKVYLEVISPGVGVSQVCLAGPLRNSSGLVVGLVVHWNVHANAPSGELELALTMQDMQDKEGYHLASSTTGKKWTHRVQVSSFITGTVTAAKTMQEELARGGGVGWWPGGSALIGETEASTGSEGAEERPSGADGGGAEQALVLVSGEAEDVGERTPFSQAQVLAAVREVLQSSALVAAELNQAAWGASGLAIFVSVFELVSLDRAVVSTLLTARVSFRPQPHPLRTFIAGLLFLSYSPPQWVPIPELQDVAVPWDSAGRYQVSWTLPLERALSGEYKAELFRPVDLQTWERQQEMVMAERKEKKETAERERRRRKLPVIPDNSRWEEPRPEPFFEIVISLTSESQLRDWLGPMQRPLAWSGLFCLLALLEIAAYRICTSEWRWSWRRRRREEAAQEEVLSAQRAGTPGREGRKKAQRRRHRQEKLARRQEGERGGGGKGDSDDASGADHSEVGMSGEDGAGWEDEAAVYYVGDHLPWLEDGEGVIGRSMSGGRQLERIDSVDESDDLGLEAAEMREREESYVTDRESFITERDESGIIETGDDEEETEGGKLGDDEEEDSGHYFGGS